MQSRLEHISRHLEQMPMLKAIVPIVVGAIIADRVAFPMWSVAVGFVLSLGVAWWLRGRPMANIYIVAVLLLLGVMAVEVRRATVSESSLREAQQGVVAEIAIDRTTARRANVVLCDGRVVAYRLGEEDFIRTPENASPAKSVNWQVRIVADSTVGVQMGSRLVARTRLRLFDVDSENSYERYMARRGVVGQMRLHDEDVLYDTLSDKRVVRWLHNRALQHLNRLSLSSRGRAVVEAMTIGERSSIDSKLREEYARSGSAHLLAVSGLHVGFVFAIINILLLLFALFRHGQLLRVVPAVAAIWIYAAVAGASPSVIRAAVMFSILQLAFLLSVRTQALNSLAFTAGVMIVWDASMLYDAGFLLSFAAVAGIVVWGVPLAAWQRVTARPFERKLVYRSWRRDVARRVVISIWHAVVMSVAASIATAPLTAYMFGVVSLWSVVVGPLMIMLGMVTVCVAMAWILLPVGFMEGIVSWLLGLLTNLMNGISEWCSQSGVLIYEGYMSGGLCAGCYLIFAIFTLWLWSRPKGKTSGVGAQSAT